MEIGNDKCLELIEEYQKRPVLWDPKHEHYYSKNEKLRAWQEIGNALSIELAAAKHKMCSLLGSFRRERSKGKKSIGTGNDRREVYASKWFAFEKLQFLIDRNDVRKTDDYHHSNKRRKRRRPNMDASDYDDEADDNDSMITVEVKPDIENDSQPDLATMAEYYYQNVDDCHAQIDEISSASLAMSQKNKTKMAAGERNDHVTQDDTFSALIPMPTPQTGTEFDSWARSVAIQLNNMDTLRALRLQFNLQKMLSEERIQFEVEKNNANNNQTDGTSEGGGDVTATTSQSQDQA